MSELHLSPGEMDPKVFPLAVGMWNKSKTDLALVARQVQESAAAGEYEDGGELTSAVVAQLTGDLWQALIGLAAQVDVINAQLNSTED